MRTSRATTACRTRCGYHRLTDTVAQASPSLHSWAHLTCCPVLQDGTAADSEAKQPTANSKAAAAEQPATQKSAAAPLRPELPAQDQEQTKSSKAPRSGSSTHNKKSAAEAAPLSELDAEAGSHTDSEAEEEDEVEAQANKRWARMRGLAGPESSSEEDDASESDTDAELPLGVDGEEVRTRLSRSFGDRASNASSRLTLYQAIFPLLSCSWRFGDQADLGKVQAPALLGLFLTAFILGSCCSLYFGQERWPVSCLPKVAAKSACMLLACMSQHVYQRWSKGLLHWPIHNNMLIYGSSIVGTSVCLETLRTMPHL